MNRRAVLGTAGASLWSLLAGCLNTDRGSDDGSDSDGGARETLDVRLYNYHESAVSVNVRVDADGEEIVSDTFDLEAPETVSTDDVIATIADGTEAVRIEASATLAGAERHADRSFDLPAPDPIEGFEVRVDDEGISIVPLGYDAPA